MPSSKYKVDAFFLKGGKGNVFTVSFTPTDKIRGSIIYIPPFAEEANRCRESATQQARQFAENGYVCLLVDLYGSGDSAGDLVDATWEIWRKDVLAAAAWIDQHIEDCALILWGMRLGTLLAADIAAQDPERFKKLILWQPVLNGKTYLTQFLRQRVVSLLERNEPAETTAQMIQKLEQGLAVEVAGYALPGDLAMQIIRNTFKQFSQLEKVAITWLEIVASEENNISIASQRFIDELTKNGGTINSLAVVSPSIWTLQKRTYAPELINATLKII